jgi:hypothetical protein
MKNPQLVFEVLDDDERKNLPYAQAHLALGGLTASWHFLHGVDADERMEAVAFVERAIESVERLKRRLGSNNVVRLDTRSRHR